MKDRLSWGNASCGESSTCALSPIITSARGDADDKQRAFYSRLSEFCIYIDRNSEQIPN